MKTQKTKKLKERSQDNFKKSHKFYELCENVSKAISRTPYETGGKIEGILYADNISEILKDLSGVEQKILVNTLAEDLPKQVGLGMNYFDSAKSYLVLARFSKYFNVQVMQENWESLLKSSFKDFEEVIQNPKYYRRNPKMIKDYLQKIKQEFGVD